jgi:tRNA(Ile)-lysidine synthase
MDQKQITLLLSSECYLDKLRPLVVGVSGGPDSLCLLDTLIHNQYNVIVGHLNHKLRPEADAESTFVQDFCKLRSIVCIVKEAHVENYSKEQKLSVEEAGRKLRYQFLFEIAEKNSAQVVAVAHNSDDQVETVLMHILRGTGLGGLRGMDLRQVTHEWNPTIPLIRPLLRTSREEILEYCARMSLFPCIDLSNQDPKYQRNRIRSELIPLLKEFNPEVKERIVRMSEIIRFEDDLLNEIMQKSSENAIEKRGSGYFVFSLKELSSLPLGLLRRVLKWAMGELNPDISNVSFDIIEKAVKFVQESPLSAREDLAVGLEIFRYLRKSIVLCNKKDPLETLWPQIGEIGIQIEPGVKEIAINERWVLQISDTKTDVYSDEMNCQIDLDTVSELSMGSFRPGDRFEPFGMNGKTIKLGDFWTNAGLPFRARKKWPLLRSNGKIVWVPGFRIGESYKVKSTTKQYLNLKLSLR